MNGFSRSRGTLLLLAMLLPAMLSLAITAAPAAANEFGFGLPVETVGNLPAVQNWPEMHDGPLPVETPTCNECGPGSICPCGRTPFITVSVDAIWLDRSGADAQDILFDGATPIFNVIESDLEIEAGVAVDVILYHERGYDVQFGENHIRHVLSVGLYLRW